MGEKMKVKENEKMGGGGNGHDHRTGVMKRGSRTIRRKKREEKEK